MSKLILLRHGQSEWNKQNVFTGWVDIPLSFEGVQEALNAGKLIAGISIDSIHSSTLIRGIMTALLAMTLHHSKKIPYLLHADEKGFEGWQNCYSKETLATMIPVKTAWQLNERMYGELQGMNKDAMREKFGEEQIQLWRRSFDLVPPNGESLKMTSLRTLPYFRQEIVKELEGGKNVFVSAHGNSLRSIVMEIEGLNEEEVLQLEIPTGRPLLYDYVKGQFEKHV